MRHLPTDPIAGFWLFVSLPKVIGPPAAAHHEIEVAGPTSDVPPPL